MYFLSALLLYRPGLWQVYGERFKMWWHRRLRPFFSLLHSLSDTLSQQLAAIFWSLWKHRNIKVWEDITGTCASIVERARSLIDDWHLANGPAAANLFAGPAGTHLAVVNIVIPVVTAIAPAVFQPAATSATASVVPTAAQQRCQPPEHGRMKCNIDAAFSSHRNKTSISICIRDEGGVFVLARTISFFGVYPVDIGEAMGLYHALQWASDMHLDNIDFEVDFKTTKDALYSGREDITEFGNIITTSWSLLSSKFTNSQGEFVRRQANVVAHTLAGEATFLASPAIYYHIPNCIENLIANEMI